MITLLYRVVGYAGLLTWGILLYMIICWHFNLLKFANLKYIGDDFNKKNKYEKIVKFLTYLLYLLTFFIIISSLDILFMTIGIFNPIRLPYKGIILACVDIPGFFMILFLFFIFRSALNRSNI
jgi:hypothetical protein